MDQVTVSSKYQVVIPRAIRQALKIRKGQKLTAIAIDGVIELVPERDIREMRGAFPGISLEGYRDEGDDEL